MATTYQISAFDCVNLEEWTHWVRRFERFRSASGLAEKSGESQVNINIIIQSFALSEDDQKKYDTVKEKFDTYFTKKKNTIYEREKFNSRKQEPVKVFITALHKLAKKCEYSALREEMLRDRIVVGIRNQRL